MNAFIERWIQSLQVEFLDHFIAFGEDRLRHLTKAYVDFYNGKRPRQSLDNLPLDGQVHDLPMDWIASRLFAPKRLAAY